MWKKIALKTSDSEEKMKNTSTLYKNNNFNVVKDNPNHFRKLTTPTSNVIKSGQLPVSGSKFGKAFTTVRG